MPATQPDLWLWVAGHAYERVFDATRGAIAALADCATLAGETDGWTYKDNRDLTGFIDGTENPSLADAPSVHGTMFVGFSADQRRLARMLDRMAGAEDGIRDTLTYYASAITGAYYFVPSVQALRHFAVAEE